MTVRMPLNSNCTFHHWPDFYCKACSCVCISMLCFYAILLLSSTLHHIGALRKNFLDMRLPLLRYHPMR